MEAQTHSDDAPGVSLTTLDNSTLVVQLAGAWRLQKSAAAISPVLKALESSPVRTVRFDARDLSSWDSSVLMFLIKVIELCRQRTIGTELEGLPDGIRRLLELAAIVPEQQGAKPAPDRRAFWHKSVRSRRGFTSLCQRCCSSSAT